MEREYKITDYFLDEILSTPVKDLPAFIEKFRSDPIHHEDEYYADDEEDF